MSEEQLTVDDILGEAAEAPYHPVLEMFASVLSNGKSERKERITPQQATRIVGTYTGIAYADMPRFIELFYDKIADMHRVVQGVLDGDDECLNVTDAKEDARQNWHNYAQVITDWQKTILLWELEWDCTSPEAALELASINDVQNMIFSSQGMTSLLDSIGFEFTDVHREDLAAVLQDLRDQHEEGR